jgi:phosphoglycerate dehydrogenase-like enzyme
MNPNERPKVTRDRLRVVVATPLSEELCTSIERLEPRIELVRDHSLLPPMRFVADHAGDPSFTRTPEQQARFEELIDTADVLYGIPQLDPAALKRAVDANPRLRWVQTMAAGGGSQVKAAALTQDQLDRVVFTTSAGVHGGPLAEFALFGLLACAKTLPRLNRLQGEREWGTRWEMAQIAEQTILVLGLGGIGREVARKLSALDATVIGTSRSSTPVDGVTELVHPDDLLSVVGRVDGIVVALPGTDATNKLLGAELLAAVKPGVTIVSVGRGTVLDEEALVEALRDGRVGFAALDVFAVEPLPATSPLWELPNVVISPHTASRNPAEERRIAELFAANATSFLDGAPLRNVVDTVHFY